MFILKHLHLFLHIKTGNCLQRPLMHIHVQTHTPHLPLLFKQQLIVLNLNFEAIHFAEMNLMKTMETFCPYFSFAKHLGHNCKESCCWGFFPVPIPSLAQHSEQIVSHLRLPSCVNSGHLMMSSLSHKYNREGERNCYRFTQFFFFSLLRFICRKCTTLVSHNPPPTITWFCLRPGGQKPSLLDPLGAWTDWHLGLGIGLNSLWLCLQPFTASVWCFLSLGDPAGRCTKITTASLGPWA